MNSYIVLDSGISMTVGMKPYNVDRTHPNFNKIVEALQGGQWEEIPDLVNLAKSILKFVNDSFVVNVDAGRVEYLGEELHGTLVERILSMMAEGFDINPLVNFLNNLLQNPSKRAVDELYGFLEAGKMPITPDGHFLAYKRVRDDYKSVHDGKTDNSIGTIVEMPRNKVDDNKDETCSYGLHFCSVEYLRHYSGQRIMVLKVNPRDVVSIPTDYNNAKGRACRYEVVGELTKEEVGLTLGGESIWNDSVVEDYDAQEVDFEDRDIDNVEYVSQSYLDGYEQGRKDGRNGNTVPGGAVVVMHVPSSPEEFIEGYKRGWKDGKGHTARPNLQVEKVYEDFLADAPTDEDTFDTGHSSVSLIVRRLVTHYIDGTMMIDSTSTFGQLGLDVVDIEELVTDIEVELDVDLMNLNYSLPGSYSALAAMTIGEFTDLVQEEINAG